MPNDLSLLRMLEALDGYVEAKVSRMLDAEAGGHSDGSYHRSEKEAKKKLYEEFKSFLESEGSYGGH